MHKIVRRLNKETGQRVEVIEEMTEAEIASLAPSQQDRIAEIQAALAEIDAKTIRPLRAGEMDRVAELEAQAKALRDELNDIKP